MSDSTDLKSKKWCPVIEEHYCEKFQYEEFPKLTEWGAVVEEDLTRWLNEKRRNPDDLYIVSRYCGIGISYTAVDKGSGEILDVTDYDIW